MRSALPLLLLTAAGLAAAPAALADPSYKLDRVEIHGVTSVPVEPLLAGLKDHPGATVNRDDLIADQDALTKELEAAHVVGGVQTSMRNKNNGHIDLIFNVDDKGVQAPQVVHVSPKLGTESFVGNVTLSADELTAASGLTPGQELSDARIQAAEQAISDAYKKANKVSVTINGAVKQDKDRADLIWNIVESKPKAKKKRNTEDEGLSTDAPQ